VGQVEVFSRYVVKKRTQKDGVEVTMKISVKRLLKSLKISMGSYGTPVKKPSLTQGIVLPVLSDENLKALKEIYKLGATFQVPLY
jgi:hypothetical protein